MRPRKNTWLISVLPGAAWQVIFLAVPFLFIMGVSFLSRGDYGQVQRPWTLENYQRLAGYDLLGFDPLYPIILARSVTIALATSIFACFLAVPLAFFITRLGSRAKLFTISALLLPVWTNLLVRTYGWQALLAPEGIVTQFFNFVGLAPSGQALYPGWPAVFVCLVCDYFPFAALPIYAAVEKLNWSLVDAAADLGAGRWNTFRHALWPQIRPGLLAGFIFVMLPALGQFVVPDLLGGAKTVLLGNLLQQQFGVSRDWPFGAAITVVSLALVLLGMVVYYRTLNQRRDVA